MPTVTLVIVTYNSSDVLPACAASLVQLTVVGGYELIIVDNASHDESVVVARQHFPSAQIITNTQNRGFASAVNQAVVAGTGRIVATLNPDTEVAHYEADILMCELLTELGYSEGIEVFDNALKWYA